MHISSYTFLMIVGNVWLVQVTIYIRIGRDGHLDHLASGSYGLLMCIPPSDCAFGMKLFMQS